MNRLFIVVLALLAITGLAAAPAFECNNVGDAVHMVFRTQSQAEAPVVQKTVAIPAASVDVVIRSMNVAEYDENGELMNSHNNIDPSRVVVTNSFTMREMRGFTVRVEMERQSDGVRSCIENVDFELQPSGSFTIPRTVSEAFVPIYQNMAANYETSYLASLPIGIPHMLIIGQQGLETDLGMFVAWKRARGMQISTVNRQELGTSADDIRNWIIDFYNNAENKPDYLLLVGDVTGDYEMPSFYTAQESNVADLKYTLIEGDDYLPEMIAGRFSIRTDNDFRVMTRKVREYEMNPEVGDWMEKTLVVAGNYSDTPPAPVTPVMMSRWLHDQMLDNGYTQVDTVFYPPTFPGTSQITNAIANGVQFASYRGWGAADGWHYPLYHSDHAIATNNGKKMPIVTSIVCNTGDFANPASSNTCFGEAWMRTGTPSELGGCVAFVGPSDLHTSTEKNNAISSGLYHSIFYEGVRSFGSAVLRGKAELYNNYPNNLDFGDQVEFYFWVYNILTDPSLNMWVHTPTQIYANIPYSVPQGQNAILFENLPVGTVVTATRDMVEFTRATSDGGTTLLPINSIELGDITVTVWHKRYIPRTGTVHVVNSDDVGVISWTSDDLVAGGLVHVDLTVENFGDATVHDLTATVYSTSEYFTPTGGNFDFEDLAPGETSTATVTFGIIPSCPHNETFIVRIDFSTGDMSKLEIPVTNMLMEVLNTTVDDGEEGNGILDPGETADLTFLIQNIGTVTAPDMDVLLIPSSNAIQVNVGSYNVGTLAPGDTVSVSFTVEANANTYRGRNARMMLTCTDGDGRADSPYAYVTVGSVDNTVPTGPDAHGYYCYDSNDTEHSQAPIYSWHTIDPDEGGSGTLQLMEDDQSITMDLPFTFKYYGQNYDRITVCSNGWVAFGETWQVNFRNWNIPAALGPNAFIAPYWDDLKGLVHDDVVDDIRLVTWHDQANAAFVIQWNDAYNQCNNTSLERFEVVLEQNGTNDGNIVFQYHTVDNPDTGRNYCTVGIQKAGHEDGLLYTYANIYPETASELAPGLALRFTTTAPDNIVGVDPADVPEASLMLEQNWPNPFNPETSIAFSLSQAGPVQLDVFNLRGQKVTTLASGTLEQGRHSITWHGQNDAGQKVGSGVYLYRLHAEGQTLVRRMVLLK